MATPILLDAPSYAFHYLTSISSTAVIFTIFLILALYLLRLSLLPVVLPGIPHNAAAARSILGDIPALLKVLPKTREPIAWLGDQCAAHNSPIVQIWLTPGFRAWQDPVVVIADPREAEDILVRRTKTFERSQVLVEILAPTVEHHHISLPTNAEWRIRRKLLVGAMGPAFLHGIVAPKVWETQMKLVDLWREKCRRAGGRPWDAEMDAHSVVLDGVLDFMFGKSFGPKALKTQIEALEVDAHGSDVKAKKEAKDKATTTEDVDEPFLFRKAELDESLTATTDCIHFIEEVGQSLAPMIHWRIAKRLPRYRRIQWIKERFLKEQVDISLARMEKERRAAGGDAESDEQNDRWITSAIDLMLSRERRYAQKEERDPVYWSNVMKDEIFGLIVAAYDTTSTATCWGLKFLTDHPTAQAKLRIALRTSHAAAVSENRPPSAAEIINTPITYLDAVLEEILRLAATVGVAFRDALEDTTVLGRFIPKGTHLYILTSQQGIKRPLTTSQVDESARSATSQQAWKDGKMARAWDNDDIADFKPERWFVPAKDEKGKVLGDGRIEFDQNAGPNMPFSLGARGCFGKKQAYLSMRLLFTLIIWHFELLPCPEKLSGYGAIDGLVHKPTLCYVRLREL